MEKHASSGKLSRQAFLLQAQAAINGPGGKITRKKMNIHLAISERIAHRALTRRNEFDNLVDYFDSKNDLEMSDNNELMDVEIDDIDLEDGAIEVYNDENLDENENQEENCFNEYLQGIAYKKKSVSSIKNLLLDFVDTSPDIFRIDTDLRSVCIPVVVDGKKDYKWVNQSFKQVSLAESYQYFLMSHVYQQWQVT